MDYGFITKIFPGKLLKTCNFISYKLHPISSGQPSSRTLGIMRLLGYEAYSLAGGMGAEGGSGWLGAGYPVVTQ